MKCAEFFAGVIKEVAPIVEEILSEVRSQSK